MREAWGAPAAAEVRGTLISSGLAVGELVDQAAGFGADLGRWLRGLHGIRLAGRSWSPLAHRWFEERAACCRAAGLVVGRLDQQVASAWNEYRHALTDVPLTLSPAQDAGVPGRSGAVAVGLGDHTKVTSLHHM